MSKGKLGVVAASLALGLLAPALVAAHGHLTVGAYELVIGFRNEPAYAGEPNGLDLSVTDTRTKTRVKGLEQTLKAEIAHGSSRREIQLEARWGQEGAYTAYVLPVEAGDYTWRISGQIAGTPVDVSMTSSPSTFSSVEPRSAVAFPSPEPTLFELRNETRKAQIIGVAGVVLGLIGTGIGLLGRRAAAKTVSMK